MFDVNQTITLENICNSYRRKAMAAAVSGVGIEWGFS